MPKRATVAGTPADPLAGYVRLDLGEEGVLNLRFDGNALAEAEAKTGFNLMLGMATTVFNGMSYGQTRAMLWAATRGDHSKLSMEDIGNLVRLDTIPAIQNALVETYVAAMPEKKRAEWRATAKRFAPTGTFGDSSGPPPASSSDSPMPSSTV